MLLKILQTLQFLSRQGLALRGDEDEKDSNFIQALLLLGKEDPSILEWLTKKQLKYTSHEIQNEFLRIMSHQILRNLSACISKSTYFTILADECTDVSNHEQFTICIRWVDDELTPHEDFLGLYQVDTITSETLFNALMDVIQRLNLDIKKCRGQCFDGASNMAGSKSGVAKRIKDVEPRAIFSHCYGHSLNLAVSDVFKDIPLFRDTLDTSMEITKLIKFSPKREAIFEKLKKEFQPDSPGIRQLSSTRWTVKGDTFKSIEKNYLVLMQLWEVCLEQKGLESEIKARLNGIKAQMEQFSFLFGLLLSQIIFQHADNLSRTLQSQSVSASEGQQVAEMVVKTLETLRNEQSYNMFWEKVNKASREYGTDEPKLPRKRKMPQRFQIGNDDGYFQQNAQSHYRQLYFQVLDVTIACIKSRFSQEGYKILKHTENLLLNASSNANYDEEMKIVTEFYKDDLNKEKLATQLQLLPCLFDEAVNISVLKTKFMQLTTAQKVLFDEVALLWKLLLCIPATNATSERSFSTMRRVKSYLRGSMGQERLNHLMILNVHKHQTDDLNLKAVANDFINSKTQRSSYFSTFLF